MFNILDLLIIFSILFGAVLGFSRGFIKQGVMTIGLVVIIVLSYILKNPVSLYMYEHMPFFSFDMVVKNSTVLNILVYELIAFFLVLSVLELLFVIILRISSILDSLIKITKILEIPSRVLGAIFGAVEFYLIAFIVLFSLSFPTFNFHSRLYNESTIRPIILSKTLFVSNATEKTLDTFDEINKLIKQKDDMPVKDFDCKALKIMKEKEFITKDAYKYLYRTGKIRVTCD